MHFSFNVVDDRKSTIYGILKHQTSVKGSSDKATEAYKVYTKVAYYKHSDRYSKEQKHA